ncbi:MAG: glycerophosphodiester phosphodiesterase, partial [Spirochaetia bacterium]|nr:glycerophosphodiester phosphodiesterase [Spirochaetia bacterium]
SFEKCFTHHISGIELDVHLIKSGHIVVIHDHNLLRLAHKDVIVEDLTYDELKHFIIGVSEEEREEKEHIPLLEEVLSTYKDHFYYDIELKVTNFGQQGIVGKLIDLIDLYNLKEKVIVSSFNPFIIRRWNKETHKATHSGIIYSEHSDVPKFLHKGQGRFVARPSIIKPHHQLLTKELVERYHNHNYDVVTWTVNKEEEILHALNSNVDGIISDDPLKVLDIINDVKGNS